MGYTPETLTFQAPPRLSALAFGRILAEHGSPAAPEADTCYRVCASYDLDPAVALAFFAHESTYGTKGRAVQTRNWGNLRKGQGHATHELGGFAYYAHWADGLADWCTLIRARYIGRGLKTVGPALRIYAPSSDGNDPDAYAKAVCALVTGWTVAPGRYRTTATPFVHLRVLPTRTAAILDRLPPDTLVDVLMTGVWGDGLLWAKTARGYVAQDYLEVAPPSGATP